MDKEKVFQRLVCKPTPKSVKIINVEGAFLGTGDSVDIHIQISEDDFKVLKNKINMKAVEGSSSVLRFFKEKDVKQIDKPEFYSVESVEKVEYKLFTVTCHCDSGMLCHSISW